MQLKYAGKYGTVQQIYLVALAWGLPSIKRLTNSVFLSGSTSRIYTKDIADIDERTKQKICQI
jgi:hypothetical protein